MNRTYLVVLIGLFAGLGAYHGLMTWHEPAAATGSVDEQLAWMKSELRLNDDQMRQLRAFHAASEPRLRVLAAQVAQLQQELSTVETTRRNAGVVDFLQLGRFVETRRHVAAECLALSRQLVFASADIMTPAQRQRYLGFVSATVPLNPVPAR